MSEQKARLMRSGGDVDADCELEDKKTVGELDFMDIEGDGVLDGVFEVLWTTWDSAHMLEMVLPDTVVFRFNSATAWYYTKMTDEPGRGLVPRLHKKKTEVLRNQIILQSFLQNAKRGVSDIVAYFISQPPGGHSIGGGGITEPNVKTRITYFNAQDLEFFLLLKKKREDGILQAFVDPKAAISGKFYNSQIRCVWSPAVCIIDRRVNIHPIDDKSFSMYDRAETFEGAFRNSEEVSLTSTAQMDQIQQWCGDIVHHYVAVSKGVLRPKRMVLNFKFARNGLLHLLWCESMRLDRHHLIHALGGSGHHHSTQSSSVPHSVPSIHVTGGGGGGPNGSAPTSPRAAGGGATRRDPPSSKNRGIPLPAFNLDTKLSLPPPTTALRGYVDDCMICEKQCTRATIVDVQYSTLLAAYDHVYATGGVAATAFANKEGSKDEPPPNPLDVNAPASPKTALEVLFRDEIDRARRREEFKADPTAALRSPSKKGSQSPKPWRAPASPTAGRSNDGNNASLSQSVAHQRTEPVVDSTAFTTPSGQAGGRLLDKIDQRLLLADPMSALRRLDVVLQKEKEERKLVEELSRSPKGKSDTPRQSDIPWFVQKLHPYITAHDYLRVRHRPDFRSIRVRMCQNCFISLTAPMLGSRRLGKDSPRSPSTLALSTSSMNTPSKPMSECSTSTRKKSPNKTRVFLSPLRRNNPHNTKSVLLDSSGLPASPTSMVSASALSSKGSRTPDWAITSPAQLALSGQFGSVASLSGKVSPLPNAMSSSTGFDGMAQVGSNAEDDPLTKQLKPYLAKAREIVLQSPPRVDSEDPNSSESSSSPSSSGETMSSAMKSLTQLSPSPVDRTTPSVAQPQMAKAVAPADLTLPDLLTPSVGQTSEASQSAMLVLTPEQVAKALEFLRSKPRVPEPSAILSESRTALNVSQSSSKISMQRLPLTKVGSAAKLPATSSAPHQPAPMAYNAYLSCFKPRRYNRSQLKANAQRYRKNVKSATPPPQSDEVDDPNATQSEGEGEAEGEAQEGSSRNQSNAKRTSFADPPAESDEP